MKQVRVELEAEREAELERVAEVFMADPAFAGCREDEDLWEVTVADGLDCAV